MAATAGSRFSLLLCIISHTVNVVFTVAPWALETAIRDVLADNRLPCSMLQDIAMNQELQELLNESS